LLYLHSFPTRRSSDLTLEVFNLLDLLVQLFGCRLNIGITGLLIGNPAVHIRLPEENQATRDNHGAQHHHDKLFLLFGAKLFPPRSEEHTSELQSRENL